MALTETPKLSQLTDKIISLIEGDSNDDAESGQAAEIQRVVAQHGESGDSSIADKIVQSIESDSDNGSIRIDQS